MDPGSMTSDARVYTTDGTEFVIDQIGDALAHALSGGGVDNVILYVHGRACGGGGEPAKSLGGAMPELETDYTSRVLMFNWQGASNGCPLGFPETEARAAGLPFAHTLHKLAYYKATHAAALAGIKLVLITHSMGNLVIEEAAEKDPVPLPGTLFDTAVIASSATARDNHHLWLSKVTLSPHLYVSENNGDAVLTAAGILGGVRLGKNVTGATLAANAVYVDFTAAGVNHAYYLYSGQKGAHMKAFYDAVMNGLPYDFAGSNGLTSVEPRDGTFLYTFDGQ
jgi:pimeloyl-ACP methyl ester carboxylesterase